MRKIALMEVRFYADGQIVPTHYVENMNESPIRIDRILNVEWQSKHTMKFICRCGQSLVNFFYKDCIWYIVDDSMLYDDYQKASLDSSEKK